MGLGRRPFLRLIAYIGNDKDYRRVLAGEEMEFAPVAGDDLVGGAFDVHGGADERFMALLVDYRSVDGDVVLVVLTESGYRR